MKRSEIFERKQAHGFCSLFGVKMDKIPQGCGVVGDYCVTETSEKTKELEKKVGPLVARRIEFKHDKTSVKFKSFYIEIEQTNDYWVTKNPSGHHKAITEGCLLIIQSGNDCYIFDEESYFRLIGCSTKTIGTRTGSNGNPKGSYTRARIVPVEDGRRISPCVYEMPTNAGE